jgi:hypothetical protein
MINSILKSLLAFLLMAAISIPCWAHVNSPDVYFQGSAGPYHLIVTVRTPQMIPGVATVDILSATPGISKITIVPLYIVGPGSKYPPLGDSLSQSKDDPQYFSGKIWLMGSGSWQIRIQVEGTRGPGELAVPVAAFARTTLPMDRGLGALLFGLMLLLVAAIIAIFGAAKREGALAPGEAPTATSRRGARIAMIVTAGVVLALLVFGNWWWNSEASAKAKQMIYTPPPLKASIDAGGKLTLKMGDSSWHSNRPDTVMTNLIPDHGYLMHLFLLREPGLDTFYHLHPVPVANEPGTFEMQLPAIQAGRYQLFADVVRGSGFPDTMSAEIDVPGISGTALMGDNSTATAPPVSATGALTSAANATATGDGVATVLPDGYRMVWVRGTQPLVANRFMLLRFELQDPQGKPVTDSELYMGMAGHAEIVKSDRTVFAHIHPEGSVAMAALELTQQSSPAKASGPAMEPNMGMTMPMGDDSVAEKARVSFPYGFPKPGEYRLFVQMKRGGVIETGVFDTQVVAEPK